jgi:drug/metabolite transporter (DMT)-like permease
VLLLMGRGTSFSPGYLWTLAAACCFAAHSARLRRGQAELDVPAFLFTTLLAGTVLFLPVQAASLATQYGSTPDAGHIVYTLQPVRACRGRA